MKRLSREALTLILAAVATPAFAQGVADSGRRFHVDRSWVISGPRRPETEFLASEQRVREGVFDPRAGAILTAAQAYTRAAFAFSSLEPRKTATYAQQFSGKAACGPISDTLMVEWEVRGQAGAGTLILADDPTFSTYTLRIPHTAILSRDDLTAFLAGVLVSGKPPLHVPLADLDFAIPPPPGIAAFVGQTQMSSFAFINDTLIDGSIRGGYCYLLVQVGKGLTRDFYPVPPFIPERFPPLGVQIRDWSFDRIRFEVGKQGCSNERDLLLLTELAERGLSKDQFVDLLVNTGTTDPHKLAERALTTLRALSASGKGALLAEYMEPALDAYYSIGPKADGAAGELFRAARWKCSPTLEAIAVKHAKGPFPAGPITYLDMCSTSRATLETLERLPISNGLTELRAHAVRSIRERIGGAVVK
jgi:hypothetical protein